jgi:chromosomal replication initiation ATPase DnaA
MSKNVVKVSPYSFPGIKLSQKEKEEFRNSQRSLRYRMGKDEILQIISDECMVSVGDIVDKTRKREVVNGRFIFCGIMKDYFGHSLKKIGEYVGNRDHTTIIHAVEKYHDRYQNEDHFRNSVNMIYNKMGISK